MSDLVRYLRGGEEEEVSPARRKMLARDKAIINLRRKGLSFDQIAEEMGFEDRFEVIDTLNAVYKKMRPINVEEVRDTVESQIDDLITVYQEQAQNGDLKTAAFILKALELKLKVRGGIAPPQVNVQVNNQRPWMKVFGTVLSNTDEQGNVLEGRVVVDNEEDDGY